MREAMNYDADKVAAQDREGRKPPEHYLAEVLRQIVMWDSLDTYDHDSGLNRLVLAQQALTALFYHPDIPVQHIMDPDRAKQGGSDASV